MNANELRRFLSGRERPIATLDFLSNKFIVCVVEKLNEADTRRRMALYGGDRIPENERNLTDVRNRMSLLIEYKLAWIANQVLEAHGIMDLFWTNVVANRFPDLEVRENSGRRGVRMEVKCLQAIAEEKSANFDTLKKDLSPETDYIVVFIWEWFMERIAISWDRAPRILRAFVFHASSLAELRDYNWLDNPPSSLGDGFQGFDLRYAVNCRQGVYNEEEGNYGKLLRIWNDTVAYRPGLTDLLRATIGTYLEFEEFTIYSGFEVLAQDLLRKCVGGTPQPIPVKGKTAGYRCGELAIIFKRSAGSAQHLLELAETQRLARVIVMTDKYQWKESRVLGGRLEEVAEGRKPKHLALHLSRS